MQLGKCFRGSKLFVLIVSSLLLYWGCIGASVQCPVSMPGAGCSVGTMLDWLPAVLARVAATWRHHTPWSQITSDTHTKMEFTRMQLEYFRLWSTITRVQNSLMSLSIPSIDLWEILRDIHIACFNTNPGCEESCLRVFPARCYVVSAGETPETPPICQWWIFDGEPQLRERSSGAAGRGCYLITRLSR